MQCNSFSLWKYLYTNSFVLQLLLERFLIMYIAVYLVPNILSHSCQSGVLGPPQPSPGVRGGGGGGNGKKDTR